MFDEIVNRYYTVILNYCKYKLCGSLTAAEDVTQEVFFTLYRKRNRLKMGENIKLWLYRTADNEIKVYIRKNPSFLPMEDYEEMEAESDFSEIADSAFDCLTVDELELLTDYYSGEREAVANKNAINMNSLYIRVHRIKKKLVKYTVKTNKIAK